MEASKLRYGNLVKCPTYGPEVLEYVGVNDEYAVVREPGLGTMQFRLNELEPIEIEDAYMRAFGFEDGNKTDTFVLDDDSRWIKRVSDGDQDWWEFTKGPYTEDNPNCGILRRFEEEEDAQTVPPDLYSKEEWTEEDKKRAENYHIHIESRWYNVATHVMHVHHFQNLMHSLNEQQDIEVDFSKLETEKTE